MTDEQRKAIEELRGQGYGYATIGNALGLSKGSVKAYCSLHGLAGTKSKTHAKEKLDVGRCLNCGVPLIRTPKTKRKKFCCKKCCSDWWNAHQGQNGQKAMYHYVCAACGKEFTAYGNPHRKYCSYECYIKGRFKSGDVPSKKTVTCPTCGKEFSVYRNARVQQKYCSVECSLKGRYKAGATA